MKSWKRLAALGLAGVMGLSLAGCGGADDSKAASTGSTVSNESSAESTEDSSEEASGGSDEQITLRFSWWGGDERAEATMKVIEMFEKENPNITIEPEPGSSDGYNEKLGTQFTSGTAPDIMQMGVGWMPDYVKQGGLFIDFKDYDIDLSGFDANFLEANGTFDGHVYGLPTGVAGSALLVNKDLMDAVEIDLTTQYTYEDLIEMGKKVQEYDPEMYLLSAEKEIMHAWIVRCWARQKNDKFFIDDETKTMTMSRDDLIEMLNYIKALYDNNVIPPASYISAYGADLQTDPNWIAGKYVSAMCYTSTIEPLAAANESANWIAGLLPVMDGAANDGWYSDCPQYMCVAASSQHPEEAVKFLDYFYNNEEALKVLGTVRSVPPTEKGRQICAENNLMNPLTESSTNICLTYNGKTDAGLSTDAELQTILEDMIEAVGFGQSSVEEIADETIDTIENFLANN